MKNRITGTRSGEERGSRMEVDYQAEIERMAYWLASTE